MTASTAPTASRLPIGVFDSGVGGLSVLREIRAQLPHEDLLYVGDSGHAPYGDKSQAAVTARSMAVCEFLLTQGVKAIVVACNTATGAAASALRERFSIPIIAMEPAVKPAATQTRSGVVGVLATSRTVVSDNFNRLVARFSSAATILVQPCPGLVERVENGELDSAELQQMVDDYVQPLCQQGADTIVLGCTHYPFLVSLIQASAGQQVRIIDPAPAVVRELQRRLAEQHLLSNNTALGQVAFWTSGSIQQARFIIPQLWQDGEAPDIRHWSS